MYNIIYNSEKKQTKLSNSDKDLDLEDADIVRKEHRCENKNENQTSDAGEFAISNILSDIICEVPQDVNAIENENFSSDEVCIKSVLSNLVNKVVENNEKAQTNMFTKKGLIRKRKLFEESPMERKKRRIQEKVEMCTVQLPCNNNCRIKCPQLIDLNRQQDINHQFGTWIKQNKGCLR